MSEEQNPYANRGEHYYESQTPEDILVTMDPYSVAALAGATGAVYRTSIKGKDKLDTLDSDPNKLLHDLLEEKKQIMQQYQQGLPQQAEQIAPAGHIPPVQMHQGIKPETPIINPPSPFTLVNNQQTELLSQILQNIQQLNNNILAITSFLGQFNAKFDNIYNLIKNASEQSDSQGIEENIS